MTVLAANQLHLINLDRKDHIRNPYPDGFTPVDIPPGTSGEWTVSRFVVTEDDVGLSNLRLIRDGQLRRIVPPGTYSRLTHAGEGVVMSDTPAEAHEHRRFYLNARGSILINGLGLGFSLQAILQKPAVTHVTIIERSADVISLVAPTYTADPRVTVINADAMTWRPPKNTRYGAVWHDIWTTICADNKPTMTNLRRAYARRTAWQGCWSEEYLQ